MICQGILTFFLLKLAFKAMPDFAVYPKNLSTYRGNNITLSCNGTGHPFPRITWLKNGKVLTNLTLRYQLINNAMILTVRNSTEYDGGSYQCLLRNVVGKLISPAAVVDVYSKFGFE